MLTDGNYCERKNKICKWTFRLILIIRILDSWHFWWHGYANSSTSRSADCLAYLFIGYIKFNRINVMPVIRKTLGLPACQWRRRRKTALQWAVQRTAKPANHDQCTFYFVQCFHMTGAHPEIFSRVVDWTRKPLAHPWLCHCNRSDTMRSVWTAEAVHSLLYPGFHVKGGCKQEPGLSLPCPSRSFVPPLFFPFPAPSHCHYSYD